MEELKTKISQIKRSITRIYKFCNDPDNSSDLKQVRCEKIDQYFNSFEDIQQLIEAALITPEQLALEENYRAEVEDSYYAVKAISASLTENHNNDKTIVEPSNANQHMTNIIDTLSNNQSRLSNIIERITNSPTPTPTTNIQATQQQTVHLPRIHFPDFDGTNVNWIRFRDLFEQLIHKKEHLSDIEKFEYLQSHVKGDALSMIKHLTLSNENYNLAWELINKKYNNS